MAKLVDPWDHHDWSSQQYVNQWAEGQDKREVEREEVFRLIARTLSDDSQAALTILDLGAGYGALAQFLLKHFPNAGALCQELAKCSVEQRGPVRDSRGEHDDQDAVVHDAASTAATWRLANRIR